MYIKIILKFIFKFEIVYEGEMVCGIRELVGFLVTWVCTVGAVEIPADEDLSIRSLANGVQLWLREHGAGSQAISCRIVARNPELASPQIFSLDCPVHIFEDELPSFVEYCRESIQQEAQSDIAVVTVGDFDVAEIEEFVKNEVEIFAERQSKLYTPPVTISRFDQPGVVYCALHYPTPRHELKTDQDIKQLWIFYLLQSICQERFHKALSVINTEWVHHSEPRYFLPSLQTAAYGRHSLSLGQVDTALIASLQAMDELKRNGFTKAELSNAQAKLQQKLMKLYQASPDAQALADYYTSHFAFGSGAPHYDLFMTTSLNLISEISMEDMAHALSAYFTDSSRRVEIRIAQEYPSTDEMIAGLIKQDLDDYKTDELRFNVPENVEHTDLYAQLPITETEASLIYEIIDTISSTSWPKLLLIASEVERKGRRVDNVHPLRFLGTIFSNNHLKKCMIDLMDSFFQWNGFISGLAKRLGDENKRNNLLPYVPGFCRVVKANPDQVRFYIQRQKWEELVIYLIKLGS